MPRTILNPKVRRCQLLDAATKVFARRGYRATSVSDLIKAAGVARGTFYLYFRSKKDVFLSIIDENLSELKQFLEQASQQGGEVTRSNCRERLRASIRGWLDFFAQHRDAAKIVLREVDSIDPLFQRKRDKLRDAVRVYMQERIRWLQGAGLFRREVSAEALTLFLLGMFDEAVCGYLLRTPKPDLDWLVEQWVEFEWGGVGHAESRS